MMDDLTGRKLGNYELEAKIGEGGMAQVYRATQSSIGREVAIKVLPSQFMQDTTFIQRFTREVQVIAKLQHPRILPVYDFGEDQGIPYIVMMYVSGGSLDQVIRNSTLGLELPEIVRMMAQIAEALDYAHEHGVVHRDFKPANVLVDHKRNLYLADFGIARTVEVTSQLTGTGLVGTPAYMAPEMASMEGTHASFDLYALGVTLFQMLTGRVPFMTTNPMAVLMAHLNEPVPKLSKWRPELPEEMQEVMDKAMHKDPTIRYQTATELVTALYVVATMAASQPASDKTPIVVSPPVSVDSDTAKLAMSAVPAPATKQIKETDLDAATLDMPTPLPVSTETGIKTDTIVDKKTPGWVWAVFGLTVIIAGLFLATLFGAIELPGATVPPQPPTIAPPNTIAPPPTSTNTPEPEVEETEEIIVVVEEPTDTPMPTATPLGGGAGRIVFESQRDGNSEIYTMNADGSDIQRLTENNDSDSQPVWSPDGTRIAYVTLSSGENEDIWVMDADGSNPVQITDDLSNDSSPAWSPDGERLVFVSDRDNDRELYITTLDGSRVDRLTSSVGDDLQPAWSPDGTLIAFTSRRDGTDSDIYMIEISEDGFTPLGEAVALTINFDADTDPAWSPDGTELAFASDQGGAGFEIFLMDMETEEITRLTINNEADTSPEWSSDGLWIVYVKLTGATNNEIYMVSAFGGGVEQNRTNNEASDLRPNWQPAVP